MSLSVSILFSVVHLFTFYLYQSNYARLRKNERYAGQDKAPVQKMPMARFITKVAFTWSTVFVLISFWVPSNSFGFMDIPLLLRALGLAITFTSYLFLKKALSQLGENYSPLFDTHKPYNIVNTGLYRHIRHPVYLCNIFIIFGYILSGSSVWVLIPSLWGWGYMLHSIHKEELFLQKEFPEYREYQKTTWRILPFIY